MAGSKPAAPFRIEPYDRARHGDGPALVVEAVYREYGFTWEPGGYHRDVMKPEEAYAPPDAFFDVAVEGGKVIGTIGGEAHDGVAELKRLYLYEWARGKGIGRALTERFLAWAKERGCSRAVLWSDKRLVEAHRLYGKLGFEVTGERICPEDPDQSSEWGLTIWL